MIESYNKSQIKTVSLSRYITHYDYEALVINTD